MTTALTLDASNKYIKILISEVFGALIGILCPRSSLVTAIKDVVFVALFEVCNLWVDTQYHHCL